MNTQSEQARLVAQARTLWTLLDNHFDLTYATNGDPFYLGRLGHAAHYAFKRYMRRNDAFARSYHGIDPFEIIHTKQIASAVEREAIPNSGDSARLPAGAPELAKPEKLRSDQTSGAGQGGNLSQRPRLCSDDDCNNVLGFLCTACHS